MIKFALNERGRFYKAKWLEFEQGFSNNDKNNPDDIANLHIKKLKTRGLF